MTLLAETTARVFMVEDVCIHFMFFCHFTRRNVFLRGGRGSVREREGPFCLLPWSANYLSKCVRCP